MEESKALLHHYRLDGTGAAAYTTALDAEGETFIWLHLNARHPDARKVLKEQLRLDPLIVKSLLAEETRPRLEEAGDNTLIIFRGIHFNPGAEPEDLVSLRVWVSRNRVVTVSRRRSQAVADLHARISAGQAPHRIGEFIATLCSHLHEGIEKSIVELEDTTGVLEEKSLDHPGQESLRADIAQTRKQAILFRRHMAPQREVILRLIASKQNWLTAGDKWYLQDNLDRVTRHLEDLDALRERAQIVQDELSHALTSRLNKNIYQLSIITVIFMPLTVLTGLFGINVEGIPFAHHPHGFLIFCLIMMLIGIIEILIFRRMKWL